MSTPIDDRGLTLGDGLFETLLVVDGQPMLWPQHIARLVRGCAALGLPPPHEPALQAAARAAIEQAGLARGEAALRLTWTAGSGGRGLDRPAAPEPRLLAAAAPVGRPQPARLVTASVRRNDGSPASRLKTLSYLDNVLAREEARAAGGDEALMLNTRGEVACAGAANVFWVREGRIFTPALECGVLDGVARAVVLDFARESGLAIEEVRGPPAMLAAAEAAFLTNSLTGVRAVASLDGRPLSGSPLVQQLAQATSVALRGRR